MKRAYYIHIILYKCSQDCCKAILVSLLVYYFHILLLPCIPSISIPFSKLLKDCICLYKSKSLNKEKNVTMFLILVAEPFRIKQTKSGLCWTVANGDDKITTTSKCRDTFQFTGDSKLEFLATGQYIKATNLHIKVNSSEASANVIHFGRGIGRSPILQVEPPKIPVCL